MLYIASAIWVLIEGISQILRFLGVAIVLQIIYAACMFVV